MYVKSWEERKASPYWSTSEISTLLATVVWTFVVCPDSTIDGAWSALTSNSYVTFSSIPSNSTVRVTVPSLRGFNVPSASYETTVTSLETMFLTSGTTTPSVSPKAFSAFVATIVAPAVSLVIYEVGNASPSAPWRPTSRTLTAVVAANASTLVHADSATFSPSLDTVTWYSNAPLNGALDASTTPVVLFTSEAVSVVNANATV